MPSGSGQRCRVSPEAYPDQVYGGSVVEIAPEANRQKGTLQVKVQIKDQVVTARAEILDDTSRAPIWKRIVAEAPQYGEYESRTDRLIPVVWLQPAL